MHSRMRIAIVTGGLIALAAGTLSAAPANDIAADEAALRAGTTAWLQAYNAGDVERIVVLYAEDGIIMPPNAPRAVGHAAMRKFLAADIAQSKTAGATLVDGESSAGASGDLGWHAGTYTVTNASGATVDTGNYSETWRKTDGKWLILRDIWVSDRPCAAAAELPAPPPPGAPGRTDNPR